VVTDDQWYSSISAAYDKIKGFHHQQNALHDWYRLMENMHGSPQPPALLPLPHYQMTERKQKVISKNKPQAIDCFHELISVPTSGRYFFLQYEGSHLITVLK